MKKSKLPENSPAVQPSTRPSTSPQPTVKPGVAPPEPKRRRLDKPAEVPNTKPKAMSSTEKSVLDKIVSRLKKLKENKI